MKKIKIHFRTVTALFVVFAMLVPSLFIPVSAAELYLGDVDLSGNIDSVDSLTIQRYSVGLIKLNAQQLLCADVNFDGSVDTLDSLLVLRNSVGLEQFSLKNNKNLPSNLKIKEIKIDQIQEILRLVNQERKKRNLAPLTLDKKLSSLSETHAKEISTMSDIDHRRADGRDWSTLLSDSKYPFMTAGENIAGGSPEAEVIFKLWMNSPAHRDHILSPKFHKIGIGHYYRANSTYDDYWVQIFTD
ncbi:MAG: hypothetical protein IIT42_00040 [Clostridia bacterium]|nr:hypothetical protein [Clostridia bacterium]